MPRILLCDACFGSFLYEYGLSRHDKRIDLLKRMRGHFSDRLSIKNLEEWATDEESGNRRSHYSKVAAFAWPDRYLPFDSFALSGLKRLRLANPLAFQSCGSPGSNLVIFDDNIKVVRDMYSEVIKKAFVQISDKGGIECEATFVNRMLDLFLMILGGRWGHQVDIFGVKIAKVSRAKVARACEPNSCRSYRKNNELLHLRSSKN